MKRRGFLSAFGFGAVATAAGTIKAATPEKRDINWARKMCQKGHRVRLSSWRIPVHQRKNASPGTTILSLHMGDLSGIDSVDNVALTGEMLEGPWEIVPPEDYPEPMTFGYLGDGGDIRITGGHGEISHRA